MLHATAAASSSSSSSPSFFEVKATLPVRLHPSRLRSVNDGIDECLNSHLFRFNPDLGGVVISYSSVRKQRSEGRILFSRPHVCFDVTAKLVVFAPKIGQWIRGTVNKVGHDHVGLLVHNVFNVSVGAAEIPTSCVFSPTLGCWVTGDLASESGVGGKTTKPLSKTKMKKLARAAAAAEAAATTGSATTHESKMEKPGRTTAHLPMQIKVGTEVDVCVRSFQWTDSYFSIVGSLLHPSNFPSEEHSTPSALDLLMQAQRVTPGHPHNSSTTSKRRRSRGVEADVNPGSSATPVKKEDEEEEEEEEAEAEDIPPPQVKHKKKKKKKKRKVESVQE